MDMFDLLKTDHATVKQQLQTCITALQQGKAFDVPMMQQISDALDLHMRLEETYLYPVMAKKSETQGLIEESYTEHGDVRQLAHTLADPKTSKTSALSLVQELLRAVDHHVQEEENELFPQVKSLLGQNEIDRISQNMTLMKQQATGKTMPVQ